MSKPKIGFICVHNSCRSQMAEALGKYFAEDVFESFSGGVEAKPQINQDAIAIIQELYGIDMSKQNSKRISELPKLDIVITMGCNVNCPLLPCRYREDWGLEDPSGKGRDEFIRTATLIESKIINLKERIQNNNLIKEIGTMENKITGAASHCKIEIYEKALCCDTGVCGASVDTELLRITALAAELKAKGVVLERANLSTKPEKFIQSALVSGLVKEHGVEILPLTIIDGKVIKKKTYPTNAEIEAWTGLKLNKSEKDGCCCGGGKSNKKGCC